MKRLLRTTAQYALPLLFSFSLCSVLIVAVGANPIFIYRKLLLGPFENLYWISELVLKVTPLVMCSLAVAVALEVKFWNIGVEGQFCMGAWAAGGLAISLGALPDYWLLPLMALGSGIAGSLWGAIPTLLKVRLRVNEIITTLLMNYVAALWLNHFVYGAWKGKDGFPYTEVFTDAAAIPTMLGAGMHVGIFLALALVPMLHFMFRKTRFGYKAKVIGHNPAAARYAGIRVAKIVMLVMLVSGGIAGLAGMCHVAGVEHRLHPNLLQDYGYTGIIIAWLAKGRPPNVLITSVLFGILIVGGDIIQVYQIPNAIVRILQGTIFLSIIVSEALLNRTSLGKWAVPKQSSPKEEEVGV